MDNLTSTAALAAVLALLAAPGMSEQVIPVPSGQTVTLAEVLIDDSQGQEWLRYRFVAPQIANQGIPPDLAGADMDYLCQHLALAYMAQHGLTPSRIIISLSERLMEFGKPNPQATQYFEAYRPENDTCIWEAF